MAGRKKRKRRGGPTVKDKALLKAINAYMRSCERHFKALGAYEKECQRHTEETAKYLRVISKVPKKLRKRAVKKRR